MANYVTVSSLVVKKPGGQFSRPASDFMNQWSGTRYHEPLTLVPGTTFDTATYPELTTSEVTKLVAAGVIRPA